jgi:hypothetical protein
MLLRGQLEQSRAAEERLETGQGLTHEQRLFLPVAAHELGGTESGEKGKGLIYIHGTIVQ